MKTLEPLDLVLVTGGVSPNNPGETKPSASSSGSSNDALLSTLSGISESLKDLSKNQNQGPFSGTNGLLFMMLALSQQRNNTVVYAGGGPSCGHGFRFRIW